MPSDVEGLWRSITEWLSCHAPATADVVRPPASDDDLSAVEVALGRPVPAELRHWWRMADGMNRGVLDPLIPPLYTPLPIADALEIRDFLVNLWPADDDELGDVDELAEVAGAPSYAFHQLFLPIAEDHCGQTMFVDLREGPWHGCIGVWDHESAWDSAVYWESITDMLTDLSKALLHGDLALVAHAERWFQRFPGHTAGTEVCRAAVGSTGHLKWTPCEIGSADSPPLIRCRSNTWRYAFVGMTDDMHRPLRSVSWFGARVAVPIGREWVPASSGGFHWARSGDPGRVYLELADATPAWAATP
ncbi:SMI1/KNR4 family protein [Actinoplanes sp. NEAU-A12]|uniref:SMI1/KNR4 family protein n=1 Tax=Actinoplanes sandaracinus TaxID=3045177 RepID=A0ABT6WWS1_9ACTN|nr:SMI1/KNR4 family protein [Actinoplanes sandaracinus]MDI6104061.1 SMI1/KNR4 family protein [Actinoplanes sandaracinus]